MAPAVIDLQKASDPRDAIHQAVAALADGCLVALPTETVYGIAASALLPDAVERLFAAKSRAKNKALALAIKSVDDALDYVPNMSPLAIRLGRRFWPGPLTMVLRDTHPESVLSRLPEPVQNWVLPGGKVGLRVPEHEVAMQTLRLSAGPLVLTSANISGQQDALCAKDVVEHLGEHVDLVLDDGPCRYGKPSSVIFIEDNYFEILREGAVSKETIEQLTFFLALVVCTGNTCRSPMAEVILRRRLAEHLGCQDDELESKGVSVKSAGIAAMPAGRPSPQAVKVISDLNMDLSKHSSQPVTDNLIKHADLILTMTHGHRQALVSQWPELASRTYLLASDNTDIGDPIGQAETVYRSCANQIDSHVKRWVDEIAKHAISKS